jgi:hypothetical protein
MAKYTLKRKIFTQWDDTDNLKRMKDADILATQKRPTHNYGDIAGSAITGTLGGAAVGTVLGGFSKAGGGIGKGMLLGSKKGALLGAGIGAGLSYLKGRKQAQENNFFNSRLAYAKRQAGRRERKDWVNNMVNRDGYSY